MNAKKGSFASLFIQFRLRSCFSTLFEFGNALAEEGLVYEDSLFSHWQKGDRVPNNRDLLLTVVKIFVDRGGIKSLQEANDFLESAHQGYLTNSEIQRLPNVLLKTSASKKSIVKYFYSNKIHGYEHVFIKENLSAVDVIELMDLFLADSWDFLNNGRFEAHRDFLEKICDYLEQQIKKTTKKFHKSYLMDQLAQSLYLYGRSLSPTIETGKVLKSLLGVGKKLYEISKLTQNNRDLVYGDIIISDAFYVAAHYNKTHCRKYYKASFNHAKRVINNSKAMSNEKLFALKTAAATTIYLRNKEDFIKISKIFKDSFYSIPRQFSIAGNYLSSCLAKGNALFNIYNPLKIKEQAAEHFKNNLIGSHIFEVSGIKSELETFKILKTRDIDFLRKNTERAIRIAKEEGYFRHLNSINRLASSVFS